MVSGFFITLQKNTMKKLLLFLLLPLLSFSQDMSYAESLNNLSWKQTKEVADDIVSTFTVPMKYYAKYTNYENNEVLMYYPTDLPERTIKEDAEEPYCKLCTQFVFEKFFKGANRDLEIEGTETYNFYYTSAKYLDLFPWWEKHFAKGVLKENLIDKEHEKRYVEDRAKRINIRFVKNTDVWEIRNLY